MSNEITDKILSSFTDIEDIKEYASSQYKTIIMQSKKIHGLESENEILKSKLQEAEKKAAVSSALSIEQDDRSSDTETTCVVQLAMLKGLAMNRELTLEEVKKVEILAKTLLLARGKVVSEEQKSKVAGSKLTTEQLMALASSLTSDTEQ